MLTRLCDVLGILDRRFVGTDYWRIMRRIHTFDLQELLQKIASRMQETNRQVAIVDECNFSD